MLSARVPEDFYEEIKAASQKSGRTMSEEIVWRARQMINIIEVPSGHYYNADGRLVPYPSDANEPIDNPLAGSKIKNVREAMRAEGFTQPRDFLGAYWVEPGESAAPLKEHLAHELKAVLKDAIREVLAEMQNADKET